MSSRVIPHRAQPLPQPGSPRHRGAPLAAAVAGLLLMGLGAVMLLAELARAGSLARLETGATALPPLEVAAQAKALAGRIGDGAAWLEAAEITARLAGAAGDADVVVLREATLEMSRNALRRAPALAEAHLLAAATLADLGREPESVDAHLARAAELAPHRADLRRRIGFVELALGRTERARQSLGAAIQVRPDVAPAIFDGLDRLRGRISPQDVTPDTPAGHLALGRWLRSVGRLEESIPALDRSFRLALSAGSSDWFDSYRHMQAAVVRAGQWQASADAAMPLLDARRYSTPEQEAVLRFDAGHALYQQRRLEEALPHLEVAARLIPRRLGYSDFQAKCLAGLGNHREAVSVWEKALDGPRTQAEAEAREIPMRIARSRSLEHLGLRDEALKEIRLALMRDPGNAGARRRAEELAR